MEDYFFMEKNQENKTQSLVLNCINAVDFALFMSSLMFGHKIQKDKSYEKERKK